MMNELKPYFLRAVYEWCADNGHTPHLIVFVDENAQVPKAFVKDNQIVLNIKDTAVQRLKMDNEWIEFVARFGGKPFEIAVPVSNVMGIFARENGMGMSFEATPYQPQDKDDTLTVTKTPEKSAEKTPEKTEKPLSGSLKVVKKKPKTE
ncbi:MAG: ClpXP protease specificity-enhancing factor [Neisseriaceae bacterium]|nr:ClpXP protease specificity-enhancing factor [Neisseriaceae bacterium]